MLKTYRINSVIVGVLFITCSATAIISMTVAGKLLGEPNYFARLAISGNKIVLLALIELLWVASSVGIAVTLFPAIRKRSEGLAVGSVVFRSLETIPVVMGAVCLLTLLTLSRDSSLQTLGTLLIGMRDWSHSIVTILFFQTGASMYYIAMYRAKVVPRWLSLWGIIAIAVSFAVTVAGAFDTVFLNSMLNTVLNMPIAVQEMVLAMWLIIKGFDQKALDSFSNEA